MAYAPTGAKGETKSSIWSLLKYQEKNRRKVHKNELLLPL